MREPLRLVSVLTRQEDEPGEGAATLARYVAAGHEVMVVTCLDTGGDPGDEGDVAVVSEVLGVGHHRLGLPGSARGAQPGRLAAVPVEEVTERLVRVLREFRPHVVVIYDDGVDRDPDRVRCRAASMAAFDAAGDPTSFPAAGEPWQPPKLYHAHEWHEGRMRALHEALVADGLESPYHGWLKEPVGGAARITTRVRVHDQLPAREQVLRAHAARLAPDCHWFAVPVRVRQEVWPTEDFELTRSHVETALPEDDLFAGISPR